MVKDAKENQKRNIIPTKSLIYLLPTLGFTFNIFRGFIKSCNIISLENKIVITLYIKYTPREINDMLINHSEFYNIWMENDELKAYSFNIPREYIEDFNLFLEGKYSKLSENYKQFLLSQYVGNNKLRLTLKSVFYPTKKDRHDLMDKLGVTSLPGGENAEIASIPDMKQEEFDVERFNL